jgi:hypothetical protein
MPGLLRLVPRGGVGYSLALDFPSASRLGASPRRFAS